MLTQAQLATVIAFFVLIIIVSWLWSALSAQNAPDTCDCKYHVGHLSFTRSYAVLMTIAGIIGYYALCGRGGSSGYPDN